MEALFIENTSQAIKDYFKKKHESTASTTAQGSSPQGEDIESTQKKNKAQTHFSLFHKPKDSGRSDNQEDETLRSKNTESADDNYSLIINEKNEKKYSRIEGSSPCHTFIIESKCAKLKSLTISLWNMLERVKIEDSCCSKCKYLFMSACPKLKSIIIGQSSFSSAKLHIRGNYLFFH